MSEKEFFKPVPFINRLEEQKYINDYLTDTPTSILFLYGPKSTGKTTLINKVINELDQKKYAINYLDMRCVLISDFLEFKNYFFPTNNYGDSIFENIPTGIKNNIGFFGFRKDEFKELENNFLGLMKKRLKEAKEKGIKPVIIIDEIQYLTYIKYKDGLVIEFLFDFFIDVIKNGLAHVILLSKDSYYIEELYNHAKLKNTSKYFLVDHISAKDVEYWLGDLEKLDKEIVDYFWENLGGSVWEIRQCFMDYKNTGDYKKGVEKLIKDEYAKLFDIIKYKNIFSKKELKDFSDISKIIAQKGEYIIKKEDTFSFEIIKKTVDIDIWFYDAVEQKITANSQTTRKAFEKMFL